MASKTQTVLLQELSDCGHVGDMADCRRTASKGALCIFWGPNMGVPSVLHSPKHAERHPNNYFFR